jgi:tetratricopeptide (TPR) repeat protein
MGILDRFREKKEKYASPADEARFHCLEGQKALEKKNYTKAAREFKRAIELSPDCVDAGKQLEGTYFGLALEKRLTIDGLVSLFQECAALNPDTVAHAVLGRIYDVLGMTDEANREYDRHLQMHPDWEHLPGLIDGRPLSGLRAIALDEAVGRMLRIRWYGLVHYPGERHYGLRNWSEIRQAVGR